MIAAPQWLLDARRAADQPAASTREPLHAAGHDEAIGSIDLALAHGIVAAGLPLRRIDAGWCVEAPLDASLDVIAHWLDAKGLAAPWRDELLPVTDRQGRQVAVVERGVVRVLAIATLAVHLIGRRADGAVWVQLRSFAKATDPGRWDTLMGGQVAAGETIETALERETMEEAGLAVGDLGVERCEDVNVRRPVAEGHVVERIAVYRGVVPDGMVPVNRDGEVDRFDCLHASSLVERLREGAFTLEATLILGAELERQAGMPPA